MCYSKIVTVVIALFLSSLRTPASDSGNVEYHDYLFDYSKFDEQLLKTESESLLSEALTRDDEETRQALFHKALRNNYILLKISPDDADVLDNEALIYDVCDRNNLAKSYFSRSLNIEKDNPKTNYLVGDYFYKRRDFKRALRYFSAAYENGYNDFDICGKLARVYEKLGDLCNAKRFYIEAYAFDNSNSDILQKIENIPEENEEYHGTIRSHDE